MDAPRHPGTTPPGTAIVARLASTFDRYAVTSERIIRELALIAFGNIGDFIVVQACGSATVDFGTATREQMASLKLIEMMSARSTALRLE